MARKTKKKSKGKRGGGLGSGLSSYGNAMSGTLKSLGGKNAQFVAIINSLEPEEWRELKFQLITTAGADPYDKRWAGFNPIPAKRSKNATPSAAPSASAASDPAASDPAASAASADSHEE